MFDKNGFDEPPIDPLADTNPSLSIRPVEINEIAPPPWRRIVSLVSLFGAAALTVGTAVLLVAPTESPAPAPEATNTPSNEMVVTQIPTTEALPTIEVQIVNAADALPTLTADQIAFFLSQPPAAVDQGDGIQVVRDIYDPFTIIPDRPRNEVIQYTAAQGDTIYTIAARFKLLPESIGWSNQRRYIQVLRPGDVVNIPPVDGVYIQIVGSRTIADYAAQYQVDPFVILDSEYNDLFGTPPDTVLPSGTWVFIPGGRGEEISWNPGVTVEESGPRRGFVSQFAAGDPGSCPNVNNPGGGAAWGNPLPGGTFTQGFSGIHTGIDLSASIGTPVRAANSGAVIFAGVNTWGYGNMVVLVHGPFLTLYGHLDSWNVSCGQTVSVGQIIGTVGNTGNSSGPHLHFEIRNGIAPTDPTATIPGLGG